VTFVAGVGFLEKGVTRTAKRQSVQPATRDARAMPTLDNAEHQQR